jgi:gas vesicle protein
MNETRNGARRIALYFLAGAVVGAAVALLTAPQTGRAARRKLKHVTQRLADQAARVPPAVKAAYQRASQAGKEAFVHTLEEQSASPRSASIHST